MRKRDTPAWECGSYNSNLDPNIIILWHGENAGEDTRGGVFGRFEIDGIDIQKYTLQNGSWCWGHYIFTGYKSCD